MFKNCLLIAIMMLAVPMAQKNELITITITTNIAEANCFRLI